MLRFDSRRRPTPRQSEAPSSPSWPHQQRLSREAGATAASRASRSDDEVSSKHTRLHPRLLTDTPHVAITRRSTRGPLDAEIDDPLSASSTTITPQTNPQRVLSPTRPDVSPLPAHHGDHGTPSSIAEMPFKDFSFIQDPAAYHVLPTTTVPAPFLNASNVPSVSSPLSSLLQSGHYRLAAIAAARNLVTAASPSDYDTLFHLLHVRLACLCLISEHALAAQESKVLGDLTSAFYLHPTTHQHLVPWDLRLLVVRLAALGYGDWRKGIMGYYELARECRQNIASPSSSAADKDLWRTRLRDTGIRVANVLVEMGDLEGAGRHLGTLSTAPSPTSTPEAREVLIMESLVWLRVGDVQAARRCLACASAICASELVDGTLTALLHVANAEYIAAVDAFQALHEQFPSDAMVVQNLAVSLLYTGRISDARKLVAELVDESPPFRSMVFNLSTIYELCTERHRERKLELADKLAKCKGDGTVGWELGSADFKL